MLFLLERTNSHMDMMEEQAGKARQFARLQEELARATRASRDKIQQWERFKSDYEALQARLYSLPDKLTHDVMVPFGKFAFMPGQLYHTNEVLVLLGDNWFTKRSVKQALEIAERRKLNVIKMLEEEQKQFSDYEARQSFAADFQSTVEGHEDTVEIKEEYLPGEEERWKKRRARTSKGGKVPPPRQVFPRHSSATSAEVKETESSVSVSADSNEAKSDEEIWRRLDELEQEEEAMMDKEDDEVTVDKRTDMLLLSKQPKKTNVAKQYKPKKDDQSLDESGHREPLRIAVKHTLLPKQERDAPETEEAATTEESKDIPMFRSPADIFQKSVTSTSKKTVSESKVIVEEKSIPTEAKGVRWDPNLVSFSDHKGIEEAKGEATVDVKKKRPPLMQARPPMPFSGQVVEHSTSSFPSQSQPTAPSKVSKFKASRQKK